MNFKQKSVVFLATGGYIGNLSFAPGTFGSALGLFLCYFLSKIGLLRSLFLTIAFIFCAMWIAHEAEKILQTKDPGCIVIDEIAGMILTLFGLPFNMMTLILGFVLFRVLDIWKPYPIRFLDKNLSGGVGIVMDDVAAGILSNLVLRIILITI
ncbi:MAG: phosphatidylglycerophosphatase A [Desulfobacterales bacterium]|jgi:phosphatidylglycerophosphatase A